MIERCFGAQRVAERRPLLVAHHSDDLRAKGASELDGGDATSPGRSEDRQPVTGCETAASDEPDPPREVRNPESGRLGVGEAIGDDEHGVRRREALFGERAAAFRERRHAHDLHADREVDSIADGGERVGTAAHEHVRQSDSRCGHAHSDLARPRLRAIEVNLVQHINRLSGVLHLPGAHQEVSPNTVQWFTTPCLDR